MRRRLENLLMILGAVLLNLFFLMEVRGVSAQGALHSPPGPLFKGGDLRLLLMFFIVCANIQFAWAFTIRAIHPFRRLVKLFVWFGLALSLYCFFLVDVYSRGAAVPVFILSGILLGYSGIGIGFNLSNKKMGSALKTAVLLSGGGLVLAHVALPSVFGSGMALRALAAYLVLCSLLAVAGLAVSAVNERNGYLFRRNAAIMICMIFGFMVPALLFLANLYGLMSTPHSLPPALMLIVPLFVGNRLLKNNFFNIAPYVDRDAIMILLNAAIGLSGATGLYFLSAVSAFPAKAIVGSFLFALAMVGMLKLKFTASSRIRYKPEHGRDRYADSLQTIAELVSSPSELSRKLAKIFAEVSSLMGVPPPLLLLFGERQTAFPSDLARCSESLSRESELFRFFTESPNTMLRYTLIRNDEVEGAVYRLMVEKGALIAAPLIREEEVLGALLVGDREGDTFFGDEEIGYIETVAVQLNQLIENDRLFNDYIAQRNFEKELDIASTIQLRLFPERAPEKRGLSIHYYNRPYIKVTGDYYDFITIDRNRTALVIADVSGHGLSASMILSMTSSIITAMLMEKKTIERAIDEINHFLTRRYNGVDLITLFAGIYDKSTRELTYINAGHCAPVLVRSDKKDLSTLDGRSKILGADPEASYFSSRFVFSRGDELILYTDGLVELYDEQTEEQFCEKGLIEVVEGAREASIEDKMRMIMEKVEGFSGAIHDDITVIGIKIL